MRLTTSVTFPPFWSWPGETSTFAHELSVYAVVLLVAAEPFILILASYSKIVCTILRLPTARGAKAFSTYPSHLLVVLLFFGSATITYFRPKSIHSAGTDRLLSLFYTIVTRLFNPMIDSLQNKDVIAALRKLLLKVWIEGRSRWDDRRRDGWMASPSQWTWVWADSGSWWWTGRPGLLQSMGSQRIGLHCVTENINIAWWVYL